MILKKNLHVRWIRKFILILPIMVLFILYFILESNIDFYGDFPYIKYSTANHIADGYLVYNSKCQIPSLNLTNRARKKFVRQLKFETCSSKPLLSSIVKQTNGTHSIVINAVVAKIYDDFICCWSPITRPAPKVSLDNDWDSKISVGSCEDFVNSVSLPLDLETVMVSCRANEYFNRKKDEILYKNIHAIVNTIKVQNRGNESESVKNKFDYHHKKMSVLVLGIDSVSRLNFLRSLPKTHEYLRKTGWFNLRAYNKVGLNTFPNLMTILTGQNTTTSYSKCRLDVAYGLDNCPFIWHNFKNAGYITAYGEDRESLSTFNYMALGFVNPPTDYYLRPYILATEQLLSPEEKFGTRKYCTGPESAVDRIFNYAANFSQTFRNQPYFGFFWSNSISHDNMNGISSLDTYFLNYFKDFERQGTFNNTIVIFLSDHGMRFGEYRETFVGGYEDRLPFIYLRIPAGYTEHNEILQTLNINQDRLTSPYDLYETLRDILMRSGGNINSSSGCSTCQSLFRMIPLERSCDDAGISPQWCTCVTNKMTDQYINSNIKEEGVKIFLQYVENVIKQYHNTKDERVCSQLQLKRIHYVNEIVDINNSNGKNSDKKYLYRIEVTPGGALFDFVIYADKNGNFTMHDEEIIRINSYANDAKCLDNRAQKFCFCLTY